MLKDHSTSLRDELLSKRPATALPWHDIGINWVQPREGEVNTPRENLTADYLYLLHAANSYPRLVEALRELLADCDADMKPMGKHPARVLLRELGESE